MFDRSLRKLHKAEIAEIEGGLRYRAEHNPSASIEDEGTARLLPEHRVVYDDFRQFGSLFNDMQTHGPWVIEERSSPLLMDSDGPDYGRNYHVFCNRLPMGSLTIGVGFLNRLGQKKTAACNLDLSYLQFVPQRHAHDLIYFLSMLLSEKGDGATMRENANLAASGALSAHLWEVVRDPTVVHEFAYRIEGPYAFYEELIDPSNDPLGDLMQNTGL